MEVEADFFLFEAVALRQMAASLMQAVAVETVLVTQKSLYLLLAVGSLLNGTSFLDHESQNNDRGFDDSVLIKMKEKNTRQIGYGVPPENKDDGDSDNDDDDDDDDGEEQDDDGEGDEDDASGDEDNNKPGDEDQEDDVEANGEGSSDEEEEDDEDEDDDDDHDDDEDGEEEEEDEDEDEEIPEPPTKKRK